MAQQKKFQDSNLITIAIMVVLLLASTLVYPINNKNMLSTLIHNLPVVVGISLLAIFAGGKWPLGVGIGLIILGLLIK